MACKLGFHAAAWKGCNIDAARFAELAEKELDEARTLERELAEAKAHFKDGGVNWDGLNAALKKSDEIFQASQAELIQLRARVTELEKQAEDSAEDWAMCGIPHGSLLEKSLVLADANRKLTAKVAELEQDKARHAETVRLLEQAIEHIAKITPPQNDEVTIRASYTEISRVLTAQIRAHLASLAPTISSAPTK